MFLTPKEKNRLVKVLGEGLGQKLADALEQLGSEPQSSEPDPVPPVPVSIVVEATEKPTVYVDVTDAVNELADNLDEE